ncbi:MAG: hypothetical protein LBM69_03695 [Lachnospiraceae bacterium]|jgi:hypothetical protein|nr:hypothetical protein [Lachnospiraceae bacterium]
MKNKNIVIIILLLFCISTFACHKNTEEIEPVFNTTISLGKSEGTTIEEPKINQGSQTNNASNGETMPPKEKETFPIITNEQDEEWFRQLNETGSVAFELSGVNVSINIKMKEMEGSRFIDELKVEFEGYENPFMLNYYIAHIVDLRTTDSDGDGNRELILFFDSHGNGGQGTHDFFLFTPGENEVSVEAISREYEHEFFRDVFYRIGSYTDDHKVEIRDYDGDLRFVVNYTEDIYNLYDERQLYKVNICELDCVYRFEIIQWNNEERILVYQYMWGYDHGSAMADVVSILNTKGDTVSIEQQWLEFNYTDAYSGY